jgi:hypothetical protein
MPSRKQKRRDAKSKRHEYEFVYLDDEGNELEDVPEELLEPKTDPSARRNGTKAAVGKRSAPARGGRAGRVPPEPSWNRALKRGAMLGVVVFALFSLTSKGSYVSVLPLAFLYTLLFIPFTYYIDRFAYRRWQARQGAAPASKRATDGAASKKR